MARAPQLSPDGKFYWNGRGWTRMPSDPSPSVFGRAVERVRKALVPAVGGNPPAVIEGSMLQQGMGYERPFSPGRPLNPYFGFSADPRQFDFMTGENIVARPRHNRVSFDTLRAMTAMYDVARMCIGRRIDSFRSFEWTIVPADGDSTSVKDDIIEARRRIAKPDGRTPYSSWIAMYLENLFRYDAPAAFRRRNRLGEVIGLEIVDGSSIAPIIDEFGRPPDPPAPAFVQFANGVPWVWLTTDDLSYLPYRPQPDSSYGLAPLETTLLTANSDLRLQQHILEKWTEGSIAAGIMEAPEDLSSAAEIEEFQDSWDADVEGDQAQKRKIRWVPHGTNYKSMMDGRFDEPEALWLLRKTCAAYSVVPQDLGLTMDVNRASGDTQVDIQERIADRPLALHVDGVMTSYLQDDCGLRVKMQTSLSAEKEDRKTEAEAWKIYIESGMASADEGRQKVLGLEIDNKRPVPRFILNPRTGPIPLASLFTIAGRIDPETAAPSEDVPLDDDQFAGAPGVLADKLPGDPAFKKAPVNPDDPNFPQNETERPETGAITPPAQATAPTPPAAAAVPPAPTAVRKDANKALLAAGLVVRAADTGRVLMLQRSLDDTDPAAGTWEWPAGHIQGDESAWQAAVREWQEETGSQLPVGEQLGSWTVGVYQGFLLEIPHESDVAINVQAGRVINPDDPDGDQIEVAAWFDPSHARDMPALRPECKTTDWELLCNWAPTRKAETDGITTATELVGYDMPGGDLDDGRDGDEELEDGISDALDDAVSELVQKALRRWRANARTRVKRGKKPRILTDGTGPHPPLQIPTAQVAAIWERLQSASTLEEVDAAFRGRPKVRKAKSSRPFLKHIQSAEAHFRAHLTGALRFGFDAKQLARQWSSRAKPVTKAGPKQKNDLLKAARDYVEQLQADPADLIAAVEALYGAGYLIGAKEAVDLVRDVGAPLSMSDVTTKADALDWSQWTPGDRAAAAELSGLDGGQRLQTLLDASGLIIKSIQDTRLDDLAGVLADSTAAGDSVDAIAGKISDLLDDPSRAELIANTELNRAVTASTIGTYRDNGIEQFNVLVYNPCPECEDQESDNPHELDDDAPPYHPGCRCAAAPVVGTESESLDEES